MLKDCLTTCSLESSNDKDVYILHIPKSDPAALKRFLNDNIPSNEDSKKLFASYLSEIRDSLDLRITFDQEVAFKDKKLSFINIYHPIIQAGVIMYEKIADKSRRTFFFEVDASQMPAGITPGSYLLAIFKISVSRVIFEKPISTDSLYPVLYDLQQQKVIGDHELAEKFMGKVQVSGRYAPLTEDLRIAPELVDDIEYDLKEVVDDYLDKYNEDQLMRINNSRMMRLQQTEQYYDSRIRSLQHSIKNQEDLQESALMLDRALRTLRLQRNNLQTLLQRKEDDIEKINRDVQLKITDEVKSLNLVKIV